MSSHAVVGREGVHAHTMQFQQVQDGLSRLIVGFKSHMSLHEKHVALHQLGIQGPLLQLAQHPIVAPEQESNHVLVEAGRCIQEIHVHMAQLVKSLLFQNGFEQNSRLIRSCFK